MASVGIGFKLLNLLGSAGNLLCKRPVVFTTNYQQTVLISQKTLNNLIEFEVPDKPKKPPPPNVLYFLSKLKTQPGTDTKSVFIKSHQEWNMFNDSVKQKYVAQYKEKLGKYREDLQNFHNNLSEEQKKVYTKYIWEKHNKKRKDMIRKVMKDTNRPLRPPSAYRLFLLDEWKENQDCTFPQLIKKLKGKWASLLPEIKEKYEQAAADSKEKYEADLKEWEVKIYELGYLDLLRKSNSPIKQTLNQIARLNRQLKSNKDS